MKKIVLLSLGLSFAALNVFAEHNTQQRSSCKLLPKYVAVAKLKCPTCETFSQNRNTGCTWAEAEMRSTWDPAVRLDGQSVCHIGNDGFWTRAREYYGWKAGEDTYLIPSELSFSPMIISKKYNNNNFSNYGYSGDGIVFDATNHTVSIENLTAFLSVNSLDFKNDYATLQFKIFTESVKDGQSIPLKTLWSAKVTIVNGQLLLEGDFTNSDFVNNSNGSEINYSLKKATKTIQIDEGVDFETLVVEMAGDGGNLGMGAKYYAPNLMSSIEGEAIKNKIVAETNFNFDIINKTKEIEINITKNNINSKIEEAIILTYDQKEVKSIELNNSQIINVSDLSKGAYFVRYLIGGNYYLKKFII